ncbi:MAG TPA: energy transducer TonB [Gemmatimonadaceae bacterium]|nr:energy transducer TonB [Gemmatimonadaceae bacterium]
MVRFLSAAVIAVVCGCNAAGERRGSLFSDRPDEPPVVVNRNLPFRYPAALYARKVQGNVTLHLYVDSDGHVRADSTRVEESSGFPSLDSAAVVGSQELQFVPAKLHGEPMGIAVLFPVYFRHPEAPPLPGDTILGRDSVPPAGTTSAARPRARR